MRGQTLIKILDSNIELILKRGMFSFIFQNDTYRFTLNRAMNMYIFEHMLYDAKTCWFLLKV